MSTINTRIKVKYDFLSNWMSSTWNPLRGELCVAVIPNSYTDNETLNPGKLSYDQGGAEITSAIESPNNSGLSPYAIGIKVGDGYHKFSDLPWIQAIAGDVYRWAKLPSGGSIPVIYNNNDTTLQLALNNIQTSLGNIVTQGVDPSTLGEALAQLQESLSGNTGVLFSADYAISSGEITSAEVPFQVVRTIEQNGLNINVTGSALTLNDLPFSFQTTPTNQNAVATMSDVNSAITTRIENISQGLTSVMHFKGEINADNLPDPTLYETFSNYEMGDVVLLGNKEYVYNKQLTAAESTWIELGDEGSFAVKGSIGASDLTSSFYDEILSYENLIEAIEINGTLQPIVNKTVDISIPTGALASKNSISSSDLEQDILNQLYQEEVGIEVSDNNNGYITLTPNITSNKYRLSKIAKTGSIYDVEESEAGYLLFDCGTATSLIN